MLPISTAKQRWDLGVGREAPAEPKDAAQIPARAPSLSVGPSRAKPPARHFSLPLAGCSHHIPSFQWPERTGNVISVSSCFPQARTRSHLRPQALCTTMCLWPSFPLFPLKSAPIVSSRARAVACGLLAGASLGWDDLCCLPFPPWPWLRLLWGNFHTQGQN